MIGNYNVLDGSLRIEYQFALIVRMSQSAAYRSSTRQCDTRVIREEQFFPFPPVCDILSVHSFFTGIWSPVKHIDSRAISTTIQSIGEI